MEILEQIVNGLENVPGVCVVDLTINKQRGCRVIASSSLSVSSVGFSFSRADEWGRAVWQLQKKRLTDNSALDWRFAAYHDPLDDELACMEYVQKWMFGHIIDVGGLGFVLVPCP